MTWQCYCLTQNLFQHRNNDTLCLKDFLLTQWKYPFNTNSKFVWTRVPISFSLYMLVIVTAWLKYNMIKQVLDPHRPTPYSN